MPEKRKKFQKNEVSKDEVSEKIEMNEFHSLSDLFILIVFSF